MKKLILIIVATSLFGCHKPFTDYEIFLVERDGNKFVRYKYQNDDGRYTVSDMIVLVDNSKVLKKIK